MSIEFFSTYQLYLLQLENYDILRFWLLIFKKGYFRPSQPLRKKLEWTLKAKAVFSSSLVLVFLVGLVSFLLTNILVALIVFLSLCFLFPVILSISVLLVLPIDFWMKSRLTKKAKQLLKTSNLKIIGIAGSYGKTTMKNVLLDVLSNKYEVIASPGNINTAVGMSSWILNKNIKKAEILLIEFGEEHEGDNRQIANIFPPDITVVTGINEAHFERMGSIENIAATIFEAAEYSKPKGSVYLNADDDNVCKYYQKYLSDRNIMFFSQKNEKLSNVNIKSKHFEKEKLQWIVDIDELGKIRVPFLAEYIITDIVAVIRIARSLELSNEEIVKGLSVIKPVEHRLQPIAGNEGVLVIDDSYNGNPSGVEEAIKVLSYFEGRRKIYLTPGLVESGKEAEIIHRKIGKKLSHVADKVILIKNSVTPYIAKGLREEGFSDSNIIWFKTAQDAHGSLNQIIKPKDVIMFQNDWGDQYF